MNYHIFCADKEVSVDATEHSHYESVLHSEAHTLTEYELVAYRYPYWDWCFSMYEVCFYRIGVHEEIRIKSWGIVQEATVQHYPVSTVVVEHDERLYSLMGEDMSSDIKHFHPASFSLLTF